MRYRSTRGAAPAVSFSEAVAIGLAPDGGLYLPEELPPVAGRLAEWEGLAYAELCLRFFRLFADDIPEAELRPLVAAAYARFEDPAIAPLRELEPGKWVLELFHGPTLAFKDFALQLLGNLYGRQCRLRGESINVLGATSGDTGAAAIHGLIGRPATAIFILYPDGRVSPLQERQMACTGAANVHALAIDGSFDDAQRALKEIFGDQQFRTQYRLSAVNSINLARVLAQCVYYLSAWLRLPPAARAAGVDFVVPTGNFGNVLAGWMLQKMGVPIHGFRVATNQNDILWRMFTTGEYRVDAVRPSLAPSMDIQVASNFERYLYYALGRDPARVRQAMESLRTTGRLAVPGFDPDTFTASRCTDEEIPGIIRGLHEKHRYIADPHTACGFKDYEALSQRPTVFLATASPAKFPDVIERAIGQTPRHPSLEALKSRPIAKVRLPASAGEIQTYLRRHAV
ncbi:MAG TPA: threonine synthase [Opitutaceae bacterium]|nr:threonine synthase [Opitutaceae bacterium]